MKSNKEALDIIINIEKSVPVDQIEFKGIKIWPLIRLEIWKNLTNSSEKTKTPEVFKTPSLIHVSKNGIKYLFSKIQIIFIFIKYSLFKKRFYNKKDVVFLSAPNNKWQKVDGKYFRILLNSLQDILKNIGFQSIILDISQDKMSPVYGETQFITDEIENTCSVYRMLNYFKTKEIYHWNTLIEFIESKYHTSLILNKKSIIERVNKILFCEQIFKRILKKIKPKLCFLECYYNPISMGYIKACNDLGIKTVEIQHAQQNHNSMYTDWTKLPEKGYSLLPSFWWCWGEESAREINKWSSKIYPTHHAIVGGNPWITKNLNGDYQIDNTDNDKLDNILADKINVLVALQPIQPILSPELIETISISPTNINWLIRLHPAIYPERNEIEKQLRGTGNKNIEIEYSTKFPLFNLLKKVNFLVTSWSSIVYEALLFGVHPITIHQNGKDMFKKYIEQKIFTYVSSPLEIIKVLKLSKNHFNFKEETPYIETDLKKMEKVIFELVKK